MSKQLQHVLELARELPLEERAAIARELLAPAHAEVELSDHELRALEHDVGARHTLIPYDQVRKELGLGAYAKGTQASRRR